MLLTHILYTHIYAHRRRVTRFQPLLARLFPVVLRLAAGPEPLARELFRRLAGQLVHWYTR